MNKFLKRAIDLIFSLLLLVICIIPMLVIAMCIKIFDGGKVFFIQERMGYHGKKFRIYKFRTMIENAEDMGTGLNSYTDDDRVTKIGNFLRNTSLDELPQLINILKGDMSFIGPRPPVYKTFKNYPNIERKFLVRFEVRPGLTGLAQINGRNELSWDEKIVYDKEYVDIFNSKKWFIQEIKIVLLTVWKVLTNEGAYDKQ